MVTVEKDDYSLIDSVVEAFVAALDEIKDSVAQAIGVASAAYINKLDESNTSVDKLLAGRTINRVLPGPKLTDALKYTQDDVNEIVNDVITESAFEFNTKIENVRADFNEGIRQLYDDIDNSLRGVLLKDPDGFNARLETELDVISTKVDEVSAEVSANITESVAHVTEMKNTAVGYARQAYDTFATNRPIIRLTGEVYLPATILLGQSNRFAVAVENIGGAKWRGWLGLRMVDNYNKKFFYNGRPNIINPIHSHTSAMVEIDVPVPTQIDGYDIGDNVSLYVIINTLF